MAARALDGHPYRAEHHRRQLAAHITAKIQRQTPAILGLGVKHDFLFLVTHGTNLRVSKPILLNRGSSSSPCALTAEVPTFRAVFLGCAQTVLTRAHRLGARTFWAETCISST